MRRKGEAFSKRTVFGAVFALVIIAALAALLGGPLTDRMDELIGRTGLLEDTNTCQRVYSDSEGSVICNGTINNCGAITESGVCTDAGCTWTSGECTKQEGDDPDCERLTVDQCDDVPSSAG